MNMRVPSCFRSSSARTVDRAGSGADHGAFVVRDHGGPPERCQRQGRSPHRARTQHSGARYGEPAAAGIDRRALPGPELERQSEECCRVEGADRQPGGRRSCGAAGDPRETWRHHGADHHRRREGFHPDAEGHPARQSQPSALPRSRRRLRLQSGRVRDRRSHVDGRLWGLQGDLDRLPHAARFPLPGRDGRRDGGVEGGGRACRTRATWRSSAPPPAAA